MKKKFTILALGICLCGGAIAQIKVTGNESVRIGNMAGTGEVSIFGNTYVNNTSSGTSQDYVLLRNSDGLLRYTTQNTLKSWIGVNDKAEKTNVVNLSGNQTAYGLKTFVGGLNVGIAGSNKGFVYLVPGTTSTSGFISFYKTDGSTRIGFIGRNNTDMLYNSENGANHIFSGGNVGIGAAVPQARLDVRGTMSVLDNAKFLNNVGIGVTSPTERLEINGTVKINRVRLTATNIGTPKTLVLPYKDDTLAVKSDIPKMFVYTASGDGTTYEFTIPHGLSYTPTMVMVTPNSIDAANTNKGNGEFVSLWTSVAGSNVVIHYTTPDAGTYPPPVGTNNLRWTIMVK